ncbi:hypothetical protein SK128_019137 [Halocaridina rubra]|uniref:Uncharacterized protein n=1 Tax=Halocaridina rubra TaxID=373956 RepID=A0AAN9ABW1_HALRR
MVPNTFSGNVFTFMIFRVVAIIDSMSAVSWGATAAENIKNKRRLRRDIPLAHFTPGNIFDTRLVACRAGAQIGANAKCRDIILPPRSPSRPPLGPPHFEGPAPLSFSPEREAGRQSRSAPPIKPQPPCPRDETYNNQRQCVPQNMVASNIIPIRLG